VADRRERTPRLLGQQPVDALQQILRTERSDDVLIGAGGVPIGDVRFDCDLFAVVAGQHDAS
jgi:hypothetical protein